MTKPFSPKELVLRVQGLLKRSVSVSSGAELVCGPFRFIKNSLKFYINGERVELTATEFKLMLYLCERKGVAQDRHDLLMEVMGYSGETHSRTLDTHMKRLRKKYVGCFINGIISRLDWRDDMAKQAVSGRAESSA